MSEFQTTVLRTLIWGIKLTDRYGTLAIRWDETRKEFRKKSRTSLKIIHSLTWVGTIIFFLGMLQVLIYWKETNQLVKAYGFMGSSLTVMGMTSAHTSCKYPDLICGIINNIFRYERRRIAGKVWERKVRESWSKNGVPFLKHTIHHWAISIHVLLFPYIINIVQNPCSPAYAGFFIVGECNGRIGQSPSSVSVELKEKIVVAGIQTLMWLMFYPPLHLHCCLVFVHAYAFCLFIREYTRALINIKPWECKKLQYLSLGYRELQVLLCQYRYYSAQSVVLSILICAMTAQIMGQYNFIDFAKNHANLPVQMLFLSLSIASISVFLLMGGFGYLAKVYKTSKESSDIIRHKNMDLLKNKWCRRFLRSNPTLRIYMGARNYLEMDTPLNIESFAINQTVTLLLMKENKN